MIGSAPGRGHGRIRRGATVAGSELRGFSEARASPQRGHASARPRGWAGRARRGHRTRGQAPGDPGQPGPVVGHRYPHGHAVHRAARFTAGVSAGHYGFDVSRYGQTSDEEIHPFADGPEHAWVPVFLAERRRPIDCAERATRASPLSLGPIEPVEGRRPSGPAGVGLPELPHGTVSVGRPGHAVQHVPGPTAKSLEHHGIPL